jgi:hypothetical protein
VLERRGQEKVCDDDKGGKATTGEEYDAREPTNSQAGLPGGDMAGRATRGVRGVCGVVERWRVREDQMSQSSWVGRCR